MSDLVIRPQVGSPLAGGLQVGDLAPDFDLLTDPLGHGSLSALAGQRVVLYFYPRDATPGCTTEACDFRDRIETLTKSGVVVLGVSRDSLKSHATFRAKQGLPFPLISDPDAALHQKYGAWGEKVLYGKRSIGPIRTTVLIGANGRVLSYFRPVKVKGHVDEVLGAIASGSKD